MLPGSVTGGVASLILCSGALFCCFLSIHCLFLLVFVFDVFYICVKGKVGGVRGCVRRECWQRDCVLWCLVLVFSFTVLYIFGHSSVPCVPYKSQGQETVIFYFDCHYKGPFIDFV